MKVGCRFTSFKDMQDRMRKLLGRAFPQMGSFIPELPGRPDVCCAKHVFYNDEFPLRKKWWNEFDGLSKACVAKNWHDPQWLNSEVTETIHEILSPLVNPAKPGAKADGGYEPVIDLATGDLEGPSTRLVFGNFRNSVGCPGNNYVFLGVYEIDLNASKNANGYRVDAASFPLMACNMSSNIITYPHKVLKRVSDVWGE